MGMGELVYYVGRHIPHIGGFTTPHNERTHLPIYRSSSLHPPPPLARPVFVLFIICQPPRRHLDAKRRQLRRAWIPPLLLGRVRGGGRRGLALQALPGIEHEQGAPGRAALPLLGLEQLHRGRAGRGGEDDADGRCGAFIIVKGRKV